MGDEEKQKTRWIPFYERWDDPVPRWRTDKDAEMKRGDEDSDRSLRGNHSEDSSDSEED